MNVCPGGGPDVELGLEGGRVRGCPDGLASSLHPSTDHLGDLE